MPDETVFFERDYTRKARRDRFYAWVGFLTLVAVVLFAAVKLVQWVFWANAFVDSVTRY